MTCPFKSVPNYRSFRIGAFTRLDISVITGKLSNSLPWSLLFESSQRSFFLLLCCPGKWTDENVLPSKAKKYSNKLGVFNRSAIADAAWYSRSTIFPDTCPRVGQALIRPTRSSKEGRVACHRFAPFPAPQALR